MVTPKKPWPTEAREQYKRIHQNLAQVRKGLERLRDESLNGLQNHRLMPVVLPFVKEMLNLIIADCNRYDHQAEKGWPRWAIHAVRRSIKLSEFIIDVAEKAEQEYYSNTTNWHTMAVYISKSLEALSIMEKLLSNGPGPEKNDLIDDWAECLDETDWGDE